MPIDSADIERARRTDLAEYLRRQGETLRRSGSEWEWRHEGAKVTIRGNLWFHQYDRQGGDAISFVRWFVPPASPAYGYAAGVRVSAGTVY